MENLKNKRYFKLYAPVEILDYYTELSKLNGTTLTFEINLALKKIRRQNQEENNNHEKGVSS